MKRFSTLGALLCCALFGACRGAALGACQSNADCGTGTHCDPGTLLCVLDSPGGKVDGEVHDSGVADGGSSEVTDACQTLTCEEWQECVSTAGRCINRFGGVEWLGDAGAVVVAHGSITLGARLRDPVSSATVAPVAVEVFLADGGSIATMHAGDGGSADHEYFGSLAAPAWISDGTYQIVARYGDVQSAPRVVEFDRNVDATTMFAGIPPVRRGAGDTAADVESNDPKEWRYRRDESVVLRLSTTEPRVNAARSRVVALASCGVDLPVPREWPLRPCSSEVPCPGAPATTCLCATVDLATLPFPAYRGAVQLRADVFDTLGNMRQISAEIQATRFAWWASAGVAQNSDGAMSPAVDFEGRVHIGGGQLGGTVVMPNGQISFGPGRAMVAAPPVIGKKRASGFEGYATTSSQVYVERLKAADRPFTPASTSCPNGGGSLDVAGVGTLVQWTVGLGDEEQLLFRERNYAGSSDWLMWVAGLSENGDSQCNSEDFVLPLSTVEATGDALASSGRDGFVATATSEGLEIRVVRVNNDGLISRTATTITLVLAETTAVRPRALAVTGNYVYFTANTSKGGYIFAAPWTGRQVLEFDWAARVHSTLPVPVGDLVLVDSETALFGRSAMPSAGNDQPGLAKATFGESAATLFVPTQASVQAALVVGADGAVYFADTAGVLYAVDPQGRVLWKTPPAVVPGGVFGALNIDCGRDAGGSRLIGRPGRLYVPTGGATPRVYSVVVDSSGISADSPWPKYQHDPRNTGNARTSLTDFSCNP